MTKYSTYVDEVRARDPLQWEIEVSKVDVTELICGLMKRQKISKTDLAGRLNVTQGAVTGYLSGRRNLTLDKLTEILFALGHKPKITATKITPLQTLPAATPAKVKRKRA